LQNIPNEPKPNVIVEQTTTTTVEEIVTTKEENSDNGELEIKCIKKI